MDTDHKIVTAEQLKRKIPGLRKKGLEIAFTNGCFDILHYGHISYLQAAKKKGRVLIIGLNSDKSVKMIKGPQRPIVGENERAAVLAALECVDFVTIFEEDNPAKLIAKVLPDVLIKGADWKGKEVAGANVVKANGGKVEFIKFVPKMSTTNIIKAVLERVKDE